MIPSSGMCSLQQKKLGRLDIGQELPTVLITAYLLDGWWRGSSWQAVPALFSPWIAMPTLKGKRCLLSVVARAKACCDQLLASGLLTTAVMTSESRRELLLKTENEDETRGNKCRFTFES